MQLTSVDLVHRGANQEAYINLYKSAGDTGDTSNTDPTATGEQIDPNSTEIPKGLLKSVMDVVKGFLATGKDTEDPLNPEDLEKTATTFQNKISLQELRDCRWRYKDALDMSIDSIFSDDDLSIDEKTSMMETSIQEFCDAYKEICAKLIKSEAHTNKKTDNMPKEVGKSQDNNNPDNKEEGERKMKIDKSRFTPEELVQYEALIAKGMVEEDVPSNEPVGNAAPEVAPVGKADDSGELHPEVKKALDEMRDIAKNLEMKEMTDVAKKYAVPLGKKEDELAKTLYDMKKSSPTSYDAYISVLEQSLEMVEKSGLFTEIGKSGRGPVGGNAEAKIEGIAKSYMEKDPSMDYNTAIAKAWENNPDLCDEYDSEY